MNWKEDAVQRWFYAIAAGFAITATGGYAYKFLIEATTDKLYTIHWLETVPLITLLIAYFLQKSWKLPMEEEPEQVQ